MWRRRWRCRWRAITWWWICRDWLRFHREPDSHPVSAFPILAPLTGHDATVAACPLSGDERTYLGPAPRSESDPTATLAVHRGNGFDAGFSPYQSTRLTR